MVKKEEILEEKKIATTSNPITKPPFIYLGTLIIGIFLHYALGGERIYSWGIGGEATGALLIVLSIFIMIWATESFIKSKENPDTSMPTSTLVLDGPYLYSRNPMYISMTLLYVGIALIINSLWILTMIVPALLVLYFGVVAREEAYLQKQFGKRYASYTKKVRRWI